MIKTKIKIDSPAIIDQFIAGDVLIFEQIYNETKDFVFRVVFQMVHDQQETEDLTQDIFIRIFENRSKFLRQSALKTWIYRLAVNHTLNHLKKKKRFSLRLFKFEAAAPVSEEFVDTIVASEDSVFINDLLDKINPEYKVCLLLKENEKMSYENIAKTLGINIGTVRSRINRAKQKLVDLYQKEAGKNENK